jgi:hypothetical protein
VTPEEMSVYFTFTLPDSTLSSFLMVPSGRMIKTITIIYNKQI